jgi:hypothetical protein
MTRQQFIQGRNRYRNAAAIGAVIWVVMFFGPVGFMAWLEPNRGELPPHVWLVLNVCAFAVMAAAWSFILIRTSRLTKRFGLQCPECKKPLFGMSSVVIASGRCGHCGGRVLDDAA